MTRLMMLTAACVMAAGCAGAPVVAEKWPTDRPLTADEEAVVRADFMRSCKVDLKQSDQFCACSARVMIAALTPAEVAYMWEHDNRASDAYKNFGKSTRLICNYTPPRTE